MVGESPISHGNRETYPQDPKWFAGRYYDRKRLDKISTTWLSKKTVATLKTWVHFTWVARCCSLLENLTIKAKINPIFSSCLVGTGVIFRTYVWADITFVKIRSVFLAWVVKYPCALYDFLFFCHNFLQVKKVSSFTNQFSTLIIFASSICIACFYGRRNGL